MQAPAPKILLVSATIAEIAPAAGYITRSWKGVRENIYSGPWCQVEIAVCGVGMLATAHRLTRLLSSGTYDFVLQAGVAGSYDRSIALGDVLVVTQELQGDLGAEDRYNFLDIFDLGLASPDEEPYSSRTLPAPPSPILERIYLPSASALTVNTVAGSFFTAESRWRRYGCQLESMEGAALHYVCLKERIPFAQIRSVSNYVEARDRSAWQMDKAISNLNDWLLRFFNQP